MDLTKINGFFTMADLFFRLQMRKFETDCDKKWVKKSRKISGKAKNCKTQNYVLSFAYLY